MEKTESWFRCAEIGLSEREGKGVRMARGTGEEEVGDRQEGMEKKEGRGR